MKRLTYISTAWVLAAFAFFAVQVGAQESNSSQRSFLTFSGPVELPGVTLEPGTYEFRLGNIDTSRNIVQVFTKENREPVGQWTFAPAERGRASDETMIMFRESAEGTTPAVQYWYFPGERIGKEFIYPKDQAQRIAARTGQTVKSTEGEVKAPAIASAGEPVAEPAAPPKSASNESEQPEEQARVEAPAEPPAAASIAQPEPSLEARAEVSPFVEPAPRPVGTSGAAEAEPQAAATSGQVQGEPARELPETASPLPFVALIGLLSLAGAAGLRALRA